MNTIMTPKVLSKGVLEAHKYVINWLQKKDDIKKNEKSVYRELEDDDNYEQKSDEDDHKYQAQQSINTNYSITKLIEIAEKISCSPPPPINNNNNDNIIDLNVIDIQFIDKSKINYQQNDNNDNNNKIVI